MIDLTPTTFIVSNTVTAIVALLVGWLIGKKSTTDDFIRVIFGAFVLGVWGIRFLTNFTKAADVNDILMTMIVGVIMAQMWGSAQSREFIKTAVKVVTDKLAPRANG